MKTLQKNPTIIITFIFLVIVYGLLYYFSTKIPRKNPEPETKTAVVPTSAKMPVVAEKPKIATEHCGLSVVSPNPNLPLSFPIAVVAIVDNTKMASLGCSWSVFEGQAGIVDVIDTVTGVVVSSSPFLTKENWMTQNPVPYTATLNQPIVAYGKNLKIRFTESDPSGKLPQDILEFPIVLQ